MCADISDLYDRFPRLVNEAHEITSQPASYNCVAWVEGLTDRYIDPILDWPLEVPRPQSEQDDDLGCYEALFRHFGYEMCADASLEDGYIKIALYAHEGSFEHVAKQMPSGKWTSKAGFLHDLNHDRLEAFANCALLRNAVPVRFMRRPRTKAQKDQEWTGLLLPPLRPS
jgi:hypothetical protein